MVDFEIIVSCAAEEVGASDAGACRDPFDEHDLFALNQHSLGLEHRADKKLVIPLVTEDVDGRRHVVGDECVVAAAAEDRDLFDGRVVDHLVGRTSRQAGRANSQQALLVVDILLDIG